LCDNFEQKKALIVKGMEFYFQTRACRLEQLQLVRKNHPSRKFFKKIIVLAFVLNVNDHNSDIKSVKFQEVK